MIHKYCHKNAVINSVPSVDSLLKTSEKNEKQVIQPTKRPSGRESKINTRDKSLDFDRGKPLLATFGFWTLRTSFMTEELPFDQSKSSVVCLTFERMKSCGQSREETSNVKIMFKTRYERRTARTVGPMSSTRERPSVSIAMKAESNAKIRNFSEVSKNRLIVWKT